MSRRQLDASQRSHDAAISRAQILAMLGLLGKKPQHVLDLGCGHGRVLIPLARAGHRLTGVDRDADALIQCRKSLQRHGATATLIHADFLKRFSPARISFDAVVCLGNTFMTIADMNEAVTVLKRIRLRLKPGGRFMMDDVPGLFLPELTSGNWQGGVSRNGDQQMVWHPTDLVFAVRQHERVERGRVNLKSTDARLRLWCDGSLAMAAGLAGLSAPQRIERGWLLVFRRARGRRGMSGTTGIFGKATQRSRRVR